MTRKKLKTKTKTKIRKRKNKNKNRHTKKIGGMAMIKGIDASKVPGKVLGKVPNIAGIKGIAGKEPGNNFPEFTGLKNLAGVKGPAVNRPQFPVINSQNLLLGKSNNLSSNLNLAHMNLASNNNSGGMKLKGVKSNSRFSTQLKNKDELNKQINQADEMAKKQADALAKELKDGLTPLKKYPLFGFISSSVAKILENGSLLDKIRQTATREYGTYKSDVSKLTNTGLQNYDDARALIYRYYHKNISKNYPYLREAENIEQIGMDKNYMSAQIKLLNSCSERDDSHFMEVFNNRKQFTQLILADSGNMDDMKRKIQEQFNIDIGDDKPIINCSYLILDILYDIHSDIDEAKEIEKNNPTGITESSQDKNKLNGITKSSQDKIEFMKDIEKNIDQHVNIDIGVEDSVIEMAIAEAIGND